MRLRAYDTVHISAVKAENLRPGEEFEVSDALGADLMKAHPTLFAVVEGIKAVPAAPQNKAEPEPANKSGEDIAPISATPRRGVPRR